LPIRDASIEELLELEIDASLFEFDEEEDARQSKMARQLLVDDREIVEHTVDVTTFNSAAVIQSFSAEINVIIQQKLQSPDTVADYQKFVHDVGKDYADRLSAKTEEAERYREEVSRLMNLLQETEAKAVTMTSSVNDQISKLVSDRDRYYLGGRDLAVAFSTLPLLVS